MESLLNAGRCIDSRRVLQMSVASSSSLRAVLKMVSELLDAESYERLLATPRKFLTVQPKFANDVVAFAGLGHRRSGRG